MYNKKNIEDIAVAGKRVLTRCDFNVPVVNGEITDDKRIVEALPTIKYLSAQGARVILCSHFGRPKGEFKPEFSLAPVAKRLGELLGREIIFASDVIGEDANATVEANLIYEPLTGTIGDTGITTPYFFYCYSNETDDTPSCTKLVLQADLDGVTYYYPILINQENYGYTSTNGYYGVRRNTTYSYGITVTRPGTLDPNVPLVPGSLELTINVDDWAVIPHFDKEF